MTEIIRPNLSEQPNKWRFLWMGPGRDRTLGAYNNGFESLMERRENLWRRYQASESLSDSELLTLVDSQIAFYSKHNVLVSDRFTKTDNKLKADRVLTSEEKELREDYQTGKFDRVKGVDGYLIDDTIEADRFRWPALDEGEALAIDDGAAVEGMIQLIDQEIQEVKNRRLGAIPFQLPIDKIRQLLDLRNLRSQRNVLHTQSTQIFDTEDKIFHARNQIESHAHYLDPIRSSGQDPDWFNGERLLRERRVLNIPPRGNERWLALPLYILGLPIGALIGLGIPSMLAVPKIEHPVVTNIVTPCADGEKLYIEVFNTPNPKEEVSIKGAIEREMAFVRLGISQREFRPADDLEMVAEVERLKVEEPDYYETYLKVALEDYEQIAVKLLVDGKERPWIDGSDFKPRGILGSCLTPEMRDQKVKDTLGKSTNSAS